MSERVTYARQLVAEGHRRGGGAHPAAQPPGDLPRPQAAAAAGVAGSPADDQVEAAIVAEAEANSTDGYRLVTAWVRRRLGRRLNRERVLRVMRERRLIQRGRALERRRRPRFFRVERPDQLWHLDMTSIWVAEHGRVYLMAAIDCCTREIVAWHLQTRCRAREAIALIERAATERGIPPGTLTLGTDGWRANLLAARFHGCGRLRPYAAHARSGRRPDARAEAAGSRRRSSLCAPVRAFARC